MNHPSSNTIIREIGGTFDSKYESEVSISLQKSSPKLLSRLAFEALPAFREISIRYLVPRDKLKPIVEMDGAPMRIRVAGTSSDSDVLPLIKIKGVVTNGAETIARFLHGHVGDQIPRLREGIKAIFEYHIPSTMTGEEIDSLEWTGASFSGKGTVSNEKQVCEKIRESLASELGLEVEWNLAPLEQSAEWLERLKDRIPKSQTFTPDHPTQAAAVSFKVGLSFQSFRPSRYASLTLWSNQKKDPGAVAHDIIARLANIVSERHSSAVAGRAPYDDRETAKRIADEFGVELKVETFEVVREQPRTRKRAKEIEDALDKIHVRYLDAISKGENIESKELKAMKNSIDVLTASLEKNEQTLYGLAAEGGAGSHPTGGNSNISRERYDQAMLDGVKGSPARQDPRLSENQSNEANADERDT